VPASLALAGLEAPSRLFGPSSAFLPTRSALRLVPARVHRTALIILYTGLLFSWLSFVALPVPSVRCLPSLVGLSLWRLLATLASGGPPQFSFLFQPLVYAAQLPFCGYQFVLAKAPFLSAGFIAPLLLAFGTFGSAHFPVSLKPLVAVIRHYLLILLMTCQVLPILVLGC
jgi:hypothetical protein